VHSKQSFVNQLENENKITQDEFIDFINKKVQNSNFGYGNKVFLTNVEDISNKFTNTFGSINNGTSHFFQTTCNNIENYCVVCVRDGDDQPFKVYTYECFVKNDAYNNLDIALLSDTNVSVVSTSLFYNNSISKWEQIANNNNYVVYHVGTKVHQENFKNGNDEMMAEIIAQRDNNRSLQK